MIYFLSGAYGYFIISNFSLNSSKVISIFRYARYKSSNEVYILVLESLEGGSLLLTTVEGYFYVALL